jgi:hypothetical protein
VFVVGDSWAYFPSADRVREATRVARSVTYYPGAAPVYIFAQLNADLQELAATGSITPKQH